MNDQTHSDECWRWHLDCAVRRVEELTAERDEARVLCANIRADILRLVPYSELTAGDLRGLMLPWEESE